MGTRSRTAEIINQSGFVRGGGRSNRSEMLELHTGMGNALNKFVRRTVETRNFRVPKSLSDHQELPGFTFVRFVVAEDDPDLRFVLDHVLSQAFPLAEVAVFPNGRDALRDFDRHGADLVVSNHSMPVMDGPTFVRRLRDRSLGLPILMVSDSPEARQEGAAAGITRFLDKTEIAERLVSTVSSLLAFAHPERSATDDLLLTAHR